MPKKKSRKVKVSKKMLSRLINRKQANELLETKAKLAKYKILLLKWYNFEDTETIFEETRRLLDED